MVRKWKLALVLVVAGIPAAVFLGSFNKSATEKVRLAVALTPLSAPVYIAQDRGFFERCGLNVVLIESVGGKRAFQNMLSGNADFSTSSDSVASYQVIQGAEFNILASFASSENDVKILSHRPSLEADKGESIKLGYWSNSASEHLADIYLQLHQFNKKVITVRAPQDELSDSFIANDIDAFSMWEPYIWTTIQMLPEGQSYYLLPTEGLLSLHFMLMSSAEMKQRPDLAERMLAGLYLAVLDIYIEPEYARHAVKEHLSQDADFLDWIWDDYLFQLRNAATLRYALLSNLRWLSDTNVQFSEQLVQAESFNSFAELARKWCQK